MLFQRNVDMFGLGTIFLHNGEKEIIKLIQSVREFFFFFNNYKPKERLRENLLVILYSPREVHLETLIIC